ncbi:MAG: hypothetical protein AAGA25_12720 [Planctomycetota bacterium]
MKPSKRRESKFRQIPDLLRLVAWSILLGCTIALALTAFYLTLRLCWVFIRETQPWL